MTSIHLCGTMLLILFGASFLFFSLNLTSYSRLIIFVDNLLFSSSFFESRLYSSLSFLLCQFLLLRLLLLFLFLLSISLCLSLGLFLLVFGITFTNLRSGFLLLFCFSFNFDSSHECFEFGVFLCFLLLF